MTNEFLVQTAEILLLDEGDFLARTIIGHRTAAH